MLHGVETFCSARPCFCPLTNITLTPLSSVAPSTVVHYFTHLCPLPADVYSYFLRVFVAVARCDAVVIHILPVCSLTPLSTPLCLLF